MITNEQIDSATYAHHKYFDDTPICDAHEPRYIVELQAAMKKSLEAYEDMKEIESWNYNINEAPKDGTDILIIYKLGDGSMHVYPVAFYRNAKCWSDRIVIYNEKQIIAWQNLPTLSQNLLKHIETITGKTKTWPDQSTKSF